jgi:hypothetical protein
MAETKSDPLAVERARQGLEADQAPPRELPQHHFVADPRHDDPEELGIMLGFVDLHGNTLVPPAVVPTDHPQCAKVFKAGEIVTADESEPQLLRFLEGSRYFRRARHSDLKKD